MGRVWPVAVHIPVEELRRIVLLQRWELDA